jgi:tripartite-type tricarboxylate transporter receptor subunit TctC
MKRYIAVLLAVCIAATAFAGGTTERVPAQGTKTSSGWPNRPIEITLPANPGTGTDTSCRLITPLLEKYLGVPVVILNEGAAMGEISLNRVAKLAKPDGYTWGYWNIVGVAQRCVTGNLKGKIDPLTDYVYAGGNYLDQNVMITRKGGPFKTVDDIVNAAKANPGKISFGRNGPRSTDTLYVTYLEQQLGVKLNPIDGLDGPEATTAIMGGHLDIVTDNVSSSLQMYLDGAIEIVGVGGDERAPQMPDVPTFKEQGYDFSITISERHFYCPAEVDKEIVDFFRDALKKATADPEYIERCKQVNLRAWYTDADSSVRNMKRYLAAFESME